MSLLNKRRLVLKVGSSLLIDPQGRINLCWLTSFIEDVAWLHSLGHQVVIVSSGSVALGCARLNFNRKRLSINRQQAAAAVGQIQLTQHYQRLLHDKQLTGAQILLSLDDSEARKRYLNAKNTLSTLIDEAIVPIVNENDTVATAEIRYGDNDRLAARVAQMIDADLLVLLSDIDGFYTDCPNSNPKATLIPSINKLTPEILAMAGESSSNVGSGGMITKLSAAKIVLGNGCDLLITKGQHLRPLSHYETHGVGTWFHANKSTLTAKKAWLKQHLHPKGILSIDEGASLALTAGNSLLPVGILDCKGRFDKGDAISILNSQGLEIARGLSNYTSADIKLIKGASTTELFERLGYEGMHETIHRDNLVLL